MKLFGDSQTSELEELALFADPEELRHLANFLSYCADEIEKGSFSGFDHAHLQDSEYALEHNIPDIIVMLNGESPT